MKSSFTDRLVIQQYLEGKLDHKTRHELEKQALEDQFLSDALEGFHSVKYPHQHLSLLQQQLEDRIAAEHMQKTAVAMTAQRLSVAAAAAVIFILAGILFWMNGSRQPASDTKSVEVNLADSEKFNRVQNSQKKVVTWHTDAGATNAQPVIGWQEYEQYVEDNVRYPDNRISGKVLIEFSVSSQGGVNGLKILEGLSPSHDAEAARLIKEGPQWKPAVHGKTSKMRVSINFTR